MRKYILSKKAESDIDNLVKYVSKDNPRSALSLSKAIQQTCSLTSEMPLIGRVADDIIPDEIRFLPVIQFSNYLIFYTLLEKLILIIRVLHSKRDIPALMVKWKIK